MTQKLKILLTRDRSAFSTKWVCNFATGLSEAGHQVTILTDSPDTKAEALVAPEVIKINLNQPGGAKAKFYNLMKRLYGFLLRPFPFLRFSRAVRKIQPDVIICYFLQDLYNVTFLQNHHIPVILMMHNPPDEVFAKHLRHRWQKALFHRLMKQVSVVQVLMPEFADMVKAEFPDIPVVVIPNQVLIPQRQKDYSRCTHTIIHVAQIAAAKRQKDLIEAFIPLAADFPDWKIEFYGKVKNSRRHKKYMRELQQLVKENNLEEQIVFAGFSHNITENYMNSDIVALPSYTEGFGYGLADGLALGLPGIGYEFACAINSILVNGKSGFLVKDIPDFSAKLRLLMSDSALREKMGLFARSDMRKYAPELVISLWLQLINKVVNAKPRN